MTKNYFLLVATIALTLSLFTLPNKAHAQLFINEFMASNNNALPGPQEDYPDWIEIYNAGNEAIMLGGYFVYDTLDVNEAFMIPDTYPDSVTVAAGDYILFYANKEDSSSVLNLNFKLSVSGEQIGLWSPDQSLIDEITYDEQSTDISYGRYEDGTENWFVMSDFTPGAANTDPAPGDIELYINEFMASNDNALPGPQGDYPDWIEIYNAGNEPVMLGGYYICDTLDVNEAYTIPGTYPDSVTVPAGGYILFYANKEESSSVLNLNFKLSSDGEQIGIWGPDLSVISTISYGPQTADTSYGRYPDGSETWSLMPNYTPGAANQPVAINEINANISKVYNSPNPATSKTDIRFTLENPDHVLIQIFDTKGSLIKTLADTEFTSGTHNILWNTSDIKAGYYFYTLQTNTEIFTQKAMIIR